MGGERLKETDKGESFELQRRPHSLRCQPILMKTLCIATRNANKVQELAPVLAPFWTVKCTADYPEMAETEIEETGDTFLPNAPLKAFSLSQAIPDYVLADDSGLECD